MASTSRRRATPSSSTVRERERERGGAECGREVTVGEGGREQGKREELLLLLLLLLREETKMEKDMALEHE